MLNVCWGEIKSRFIFAEEKPAPSALTSAIPGMAATTERSIFGFIGTEFGIAEMKGKINLLTENAPAIADSEIGTFPSNSERHPFYDDPLKK